MIKPLQLIKKNIKSHDLQESVRKENKNKIRFVHRKLILQPMSQQRKIFFLTNIKITFAS